jgi:hypothetical protein
MHPQRAFVVHFTETFLESCKDYLEEEDIKNITFRLSTDSLLGTVVPGVPNLRQLDQMSCTSSISYSVWYLYFDDIPHVEVVGFSKSEDEPKIVVCKKTIWRMLKLTLFLRSAYKAYELARSHISDIF